MSASERQILGAVIAALLAVIGIAMGCSRDPRSPQDEADVSARVLIDRAAEVGVDFTYDPGAEGEFYFPEISGGGGALLDFDGDGDLDLFVVQGGSVEAAYLGTATVERSGDRLFRNDRTPGTPASRFVDVTEAAGIADSDFGQGVAVGDVDNDGRPDIYVTNAGANRLWRNLGDGRFADVTSAAGVAGDRWSTSATFFDFDRDGWLDLFVANYVDFRLESHRDCRSTSGALDYCGPLSYNPERDRLYRNRGDGTFEDVSGRSGIGASAGNGLGVVVADFDRDGWPDVFVANDLMVNFLWMNQGDGTFVDEAALAGCAVNMEGAEEASMGVAAADFDDDGAVDLFMTHLDGETNTFYQGDGNGLFEDRTAARSLAAPSLPHTGFGTVPIDFDNDGRQDLLVVNGAVYTMESQRLAGEVFPFRQPNHLYRNGRDGTFTEVPHQGAGFFPEVSRGAAMGDVDGDGKSDVVVFNVASPLRLLMNEGGGDAGWLGVRALTGAGSRDALGTLVETVLDGGSRYRRIHRDGSYCSSHSPWVLTGLDDASPRVLKLTWPDGRRTLIHEPPAGKYLTVVGS